MTHSDDDGLVLPPRLAPAHVVILPVYRPNVPTEGVDRYCDELAAALRARSFAGEPLRVKIDRRDMRGGEKGWEHVKKGVPVRLEIGPRDVDSNVVFMARRDRPAREKISVPREQFIAGIPALLEEIQAGLLERARAHRDKSTTQVSSVEEFRACFSEQGPGGFASCYAADTAEYAGVLAELKVSARCMPLDHTKRGPCIFTGRPDSPRTLFAQAY
jgi:prolyl-tRNA synthetase